MLVGSNIRLLDSPHPKCRIRKLKRTSICCDGVRHPYLTALSSNQILIGPIPEAPQITEPTTTLQAPRGRNTAPASLDQGLSREGQRRQVLSDPIE